MNVVKFENPVDGSLLGAPKNNMPDYHYLPLDRLKPFPQMRGVAFEDLDAADLVASVKENGVIQALLACPIDGDDRHYAVICGHRRLKAALEAGKPDAPVVIRPELIHGRPECVEPIQRLQIEENLHRQTLTPMQEAGAVQTYLNENGLSVSQTARNLGLTRPAVQDLLKIATLSEARLAGARQMAGGRKEMGPSEPTLAHRLGAMPKTALLILAQCQDEAFFPELLKRCQRGDSVRALKKFVETADRKPKPRKTGYVAVQKLSGLIFGNHMRVAIRIDATPALLNGQATFNQKNWELGRRALPELHRALDEAIETINPKPKPGEPPDPAGKDSKPKKKTSAVHEAGKVSSEPAKEEPDKSTKAPPGRHAPSEPRPSAAELMAKASPATQAARRHWSQIRSELRKPPMSEWEYRSYLASSKVAGEIGETVLVALASETACAWTRQVCGDRLTELTKGQRPIAFIDRKGMAHG